MFCIGVSDNYNVHASQHHTVLLALISNNEHELQCWDRHKPDVQQQLLLCLRAVTEPLCSSLNNVTMFTTLSGSPRVYGTLSHCNLPKGSNCNSIVLCYFTGRQAMIDCQCLVFASQQSCSAYCSLQNPGKSWCVVLNSKVTQHKSFPCGTTYA